MTLYKYGALLKVRIYRYIQEEITKGTKERIATRIIIKPKIIMRQLNNIPTYTEWYNIYKNIIHKFTKYVKDISKLLFLSCRLFFFSFFCC